MKIFFDESGQTGIVMPNKNSKLYGRNQRHFVLAGVIVKTEDDEKLLRDRYSEFKDKFNIEGEFKGTELFIEENKEILEYFINHMLDGRYFTICVYDKHFYIATLIVAYFLSLDFRDESPVLFYSFCNDLCQENEDILYAYCRSVKNNSPKEFIEFISTFDFEVGQNSAFAEAAKEILEKNMPIAEFDLTCEAYIRESTVNLVNLTALGELILALKVMNPTVKQFDIIHDIIDEFKEDYLDSFEKRRDVNFSFKDSKEDELLQYADNIASLYRRLFAHMIESFADKKAWSNDAEYLLETYSKVINKLGKCMIKFVVPISDQALVYCTRDMFESDYPKSNRSNFVFNPKYQRHINFIIKNLEKLDFKHAKL